MSDHIIANVIFAEGYTILRNELSLHSIFNTYARHEDDAANPWTFFVYVTARGLRPGNASHVDVEITFGDEAGIESFGQFQAPLDVDAATATANALVAIERVTLPRLGRYTVSVRIAEVVVAEEPLFVVSPSKE